MNRFFTKSIALIALVGVMTAFSTSKAEAALSMVITTSAGGAVTINDDNLPPGTGADITPGIGAVTWSGGLVGGWVVNVDTGVGFPIFGDQPHMDLNYITVNSGGGAGSWLQIDFIQTLTAPGSNGLAMKIGGTNTGTSVVANVLRNGVVTGTLGPLGAGAFAATGAATNGLASPYTLTQRVRITLTGASGNASGDFEIIPEPASLALMGLGLAGLAARRRRQA